MSKIIVIGLGYVGLSNALLLSKSNDVVGVDNDLNKLEMLNKKISPLDELDIKNELKKSNITFTDNYLDHLENSYVIIALPTNFNEAEKRFETSIIENIIEIILNKANVKAIIIKSTVPVGFCNEVNERYGTDKVYFSPEFLREGKAMYDSFWPSRIVIGGKKEEIKKEFCDFYIKNIKNNAEVIKTNAKEAEAIKLFSNTYLAMRVAFFNEIDNYCIENDMEVKDVITGMSLDKRIGNGYNNPSFGYGGYCLPKDTKQAESNFENINQSIISAIVSSNQKRIEYLVEHLSRTNKKIGIYRLLMKKDSDNIRSSSTSLMMDECLRRGLTVFLYEPKYDIELAKKQDIVLLNSVEELSNSDVIIANRIDKEIKIFEKKVFTRDIFESDL